MYREMTKSKMIPDAESESQSQDDGLVDDFTAVCLRSMYIESQGMKDYPIIGIPFNIPGHWIIKFIDIHPKRILLLDTALNKDYER